MSEKAWKLADDGTPFVYQLGPNGANRFSFYIQGQGNHPDSASAEERLAIAERIIEDHVACAGLAAPSAAIEAAREVLASAVERLEEVQSHDLFFHEWKQKARRALALLSEGGV